MSATVGREHEVDLLVEDSVVLRDGDRDDEDAEDVVAVALEPRTGRRAHGRVGEQLLERAPVELDRRFADELVPRGVEEVDPAHAAGHSARLAPRGV